MQERSNPAAKDLKQAIDDLVTAISADASWCAWRATVEAFERDSELKELMKRYNKLANRWQQSGGDEPELTELAEQIQNHRLVRERSLAVASMTEFLQSVNVMLSEKLGLDFATTAAPQRGGCCG